MRNWSLVFLTVGLVAAYLGFTEVTGTTIEPAQFISIVFLVLSLVCFVLHAARKKQEKGAVRGRHPGQF